MSTIENNSSVGTEHDGLLIRRAQILESLRLNSESDDRSGMASNHYELGNLYLHLRDYKMAAEHFRKAFETLPEVVPGSTVEMHVPDMVPKDFAHVNVLIVEDNKINQLLLKNMLKMFGFSNSDCADNGKTALNRITENKYDLILMDIQMPGMDGYEITTRIRTNMPDSVGNIPIIALTADASDTEKAKAREAGMNEYVVKPHTPEELYCTMLKCLNMPAKPAEVNLKKKTVQKKRFTERKKKQGMDLEFLEKFTGGDPGITVQLIELFLKDVPESIVQLENFIPQGHWKEVHHVSHKVKSCFAVFELNVLRKIIISIEEYSRDLRHLDDVPELFLEFKKGCKEALLNLEVELKRMKEARA